MTRQAPTLHEVAARAGVSIATVSRVVRDLKSVTPATRDRVNEAIRELNYRPSHLGRALVNQRHDTIGFIVPGIRGPFFAEVVHGCMEAALSAGRQVLIYSNLMVGDAYNDNDALALPGRVDGLAVFGGTISVVTLSKLRDTGCPLVLVSQHPDLGIPTVRIDNTSALRQLVLHLIDDHGYRDIAFAGSFIGSPDAEDRWSTVVHTLAEAGITPPTEPIPAGFNMPDGARVAEWLYNQSSLPDVVICGNDEMAIGAIGALKERGISVPDDVAITGFDDIDVAAHIAPALTTVRQHTGVLGLHVGRTLIRLMNDEPVDDDIQLPCDLVVRRSCGCTTPSPTLFTNDLAAMRSAEGGA